MLTGRLSCETLRLSLFVEYMDRRDMCFAPAQEISTEDPKEVIALGLPKYACGFRVFSRVVGTTRVDGRTVEIGSSGRVEEGPTYRICEVVTPSYLEALLSRADASEGSVIRSLLQRFGASSHARILKTGTRYDVVTDTKIVVIDVVGDPVTAVLNEPPKS